MQSHLLRAVRRHMVWSGANVPTVSRQDRRRSIVPWRSDHLLPATILECYWLEERWPPKRWSMLMKSNVSWLCIPTGKAFENRSHRKLKIKCWTTYKCQSYRLYLDVHFAVVQSVKQIPTFPEHSDNREEPRVWECFAEVMTRFSPSYKRTCRKRKRRNTFLYTEKNILQLNKSPV